MVRRLAFALTTTLGVATKSAPRTLSRYASRRRLLLLLLLSKGGLGVSLFLVVSQVTRSGVTRRLRVLEARRATDDATLFL